MPSTQEERKNKAESLFWAAYNKTNDENIIAKEAHDFIVECGLVEDWETVDWLLNAIIQCTKFSWIKLNLSGTEDKNPDNILNIIGQREYVKPADINDLGFGTRLSFFCGHLAEKFGIADIEAYFDEYYLSEHEVDSSESKMTGLTIDEHHQ